MLIYLYLIKTIFLEKIERINKSFNNKNYFITIIPPKTFISYQQLNNEKELFDCFNIQKENYLPIYADQSTFIKITTLINNKETNVAGCFMKTVENKFNNTISTKFKKLKKKNSITSFSLIEDYNKDINSNKNIKYKMIIIYCLFVYPDFRNKGISNFLLDFIESKYSYDIFSLAVNPKSIFGVINFYNYFKNDFRYLNFIKVNPPELFSKNFNDFFNSFCFNLNDLKKFCNSISFKENIKYIVLSKFNKENEKRLNIEKVSKDEIFKLVNEMFIILNNINNKEK